MSLRNPDNIYLDLERNGCGVSYLTPDAEDAVRWVTQALALPSMAATTPEGKVKTRVRQILEMFGVYYFFPATGGFGNSGVPDIVVCAWGHFLAIECKAGNNTTTALQAREIENIVEAGGTALVIREGDMDKLAITLAALKGKYGNNGPTK